jgi:hypothetical protein
MGKMFSLPLMTNYFHITIPLGESVVTFLLVIIKAKNYKESRREEKDES